MVGVHRDPLVQCLPADAQLRVTALEELEGDQRRQGICCWRGAMLDSTSCPRPPALFFLSEPPPRCHPMFIPTSFFHCMHEGEIWLWRSGCPAHAG